MTGGGQGERVAAVELGRLKGGHGVRANLRWDGCGGRGGKRKEHVVALATVPFNTMGRIIYIANL